MSDKILIVDFEDSFTFNIANVLYPYEARVSVVSHRDFFQKLFPELLRSTQKYAVVLGPGPGHPDDYEKYYSYIRKLMENPQCYLMGICLGHQILGKIEGHEVRRSQHPMHGQTVEVNFRGRMIRVQRYNSLAVYIDGIESEIVEFKHGISYQFHPESIGTHENDIFFNDLLTFIKS